MLARRIIPCLDVRDGRTVKGTRFEDLRDAGDPVELARRYSEEGADEIVFLDITATSDGRDTLRSLVERIAREIDIPFTVGGGVRTVDDARALLRGGADKIAVNSAAVGEPELVTRLAREFGSQAVVVAIDSGATTEGHKVFTHGGRRETAIPTEEWATRAVALGAGELLVTSIAHDGVKRGFDLDLIERLGGSLSVPVIASGGAGSREHFADILAPGRADAALAASVFHFGEMTIRGLKQYLDERGIPVRRVYEA